MKKTITELLHKKPELSAVKTNLLLAAYFTLVMNPAFFRESFSLYQHTGTSADYFLYTLPVVLFAGCNLIFNLLSVPFFHKLIMPLLIVLSAAVGYNSFAFNTYFDRQMLDNVLQTNFAESVRMFSLPYILWLLFFGILPALLYLRIKIIYSVWWKELLRRLLSGIGSVLAVLAVAAFFYQDYASFFRNNLFLPRLIVPSNIIAAGVSKIKHLRADNMPYQATGKDAKMFKPDNYPHVLILVVGETTRAQNWGLNGYTRQTTPKLAARQQKGESLINFPNVRSCGTATAISVPCMFSSLTRETYDEAAANHQDNLLDTLQYSGIKVHWIENNSDCKGVCHNVPTTDTIHLNLPDMCREGECLDNIMLPEVDKLLAQVKKDTVIVVHTIGSHGPTYFERYTGQERLFKPTCDTKEINRCTREELTNTYDNTIVYIDQFLDKLIARLQAHPNWESGLYYVSDHGESLGEDGIYLHATPYAIAPDEQTRVPMIMWFSQAWTQNEPFDLGCLRKNAARPYSQDHFFHTVFSMMDIKMNSVKQYRQDLDILAACRKPAGKH